MKRLLIIFAIIVLGSLPLFSQNVSIPDANFLAALIAEGVDTNEDGQISVAEAEGVTELVFYSKQISDLSGIEAFINLTKLYCGANFLTNLDISKNTNLIELLCESCQLTSLDVSNNTSLNSLYCPDNQLTSLDVSNNKGLTQLNCGYNQLTILDVLSNTGLWNLDCSSNQLTSLDVSTNLALNMLFCNGNQLTSLDVSNNTSIEILNCNDNELTNLDVTNNPMLQKLECGGNQLISLDISNNTLLYILNSSSNQLVSLDVRLNPNLFGGCDYDSESHGALVVSDMQSLVQVCVPEIYQTWGYWCEIDSTNSPNVYFDTICASMNPTQIELSDITKEINIYPNPTDGIISIDIYNPLNANIEIYNTNGSLIYSKPLKATQQQIDLSAYPKGLYFVKVRQQGMVKIGKVLLE